MPAEIELTPVPHCPICGAAERDFAFTGREHEYDNTTTLPFNFFRCRGCTAVYPDPRPAESSLSVIYPPNYYSRAAGVNASPDALDLTSFVGRTLHKMAVNRIAGNLAPYLRLGPGHTLLDIGCGSARHLRSIQIETGCHAEGLDFEIRDELLQKFSAPPLVLRRGDFLSYDFGEQRYDVVYAAHLIEHVADPIAFLRKIDSILKPGGVCVLETPNEDCLGARLFGADWGGNHIPRHWFLPNPHSAEIMVKRAAPDSLVLLKVKFIPITFVIWSLHSFLVTRGFKRLADVLFPSDDRYMKTTPVNLVRHGLAHVVSRLEGLITGKTSCMITVIGKRSAANATS